MSDGVHVEQRLVAIADILGFKALVQTMRADALAEQVWEIVQAAEATKERRSAVYVGGSKVLDRSFHIEMLHFSDTIAFWSEPIPQGGARTTETVISTFIDYVAEVAFRSFVSNLPLRIGMSCGSVFADPARRIIVGQAVVDAYLTEQEQDWIGGAFHASFPVSPTTHIVKYAAPTKSPDVALPWALEWFAPALRLGGENWTNSSGRPYREIFRELLTSGSTNSDSRVRRKYENTSQFFEHQVRGLRGNMFVGGKPQPD